uniref:RBR-type E3 ubiquitin transferase n=1 Tax=Schizophyllum commune (strain H4-8 / FGSC 9210) TaxID=578458 RepID=D8PV29_SCHCM
MVQVRVAFDDGDAAERARISLDGQRRFSWNWHWPLYTRLDEPVQYKLSIPVRQYNVQKRQWDELAGSGAAASLRIDAPRHPGRPHVFIQISGKEKEAVGQLKVRAEDLARGQVLAAWAVGLTERFLDGVAERTGTFILRDARTRALKAFGEPAAVLAAREQIQEEEDRLAALEISIPVKPAVVAYFLRQGIPALKEELGEENVKLDGPRARCHVVVRGGEAARRAVERHIIDSATYRPSAAVDATCPVCYMEPSAPFRLGCGHIYCTACAKHLLSSATENKTFPLLCIGEDATCGLFDAAFTAHIERNPDRLKYCRTAACEQVYATDGEQQFLSCPSCFATVCTGCNEGAHVGRTCRENARDVQRKHDEKLNDALIAEQNFKRCPSCQVLVEKTEGCNHISCRCGAHFCWRCTRVFPRDEIYNHMTEAHGGIYEDVRPAQAPQRAPPPQYPVPPRPREFEYDAVDVMEQHRILRDIAQRREVAQRRTIEERNRQARQTEAAQYQREAYINRQWQMEAQRLEIEQRQREEAQRRNSGWGCTVM